MRPANSSYNPDPFGPLLPGRQGQAANVPVQTPDPATVTTTATTTTTTTTDTASSTQTSTSTPSDTATTTTTSTAAITTTTSTLPPQLSNQAENVLDVSANGKRQMAEGYTEVVKLLLEKGANPALSDNLDSPMEMALRRGRSEIVELLRQAWALKSTV